MVAFLIFKVITKMLGLDTVYNFIVLTASQNRLNSWIWWNIFTLYETNLTGMRIEDHNRTLSFIFSPSVMKFHQIFCQVPSDEK